MNELRVPVDCAKALEGAEITHNRNTVPNYLLSSMPRCNVTQENRARGHPPTGNSEGALDVLLVHRPHDPKHQATEQENHEHYCPYPSPVPVFLEVDSPANDGLIQLTGQSPLKFLRDLLEDPGLLLIDALWVLQKMNHLIRTDRRGRSGRYWMAAVFWWR